MSGPGRRRPPPHSASPAALTGGGQGPPEPRREGPEKAVRCHNPPRGLRQTRPAPAAKPRPKGPDVRPPPAGQVPGSALGRGGSAVTASPPRAASGARRGQPAASLSIGDTPRWDGSAGSASKRGAAAALCGGVGARWERARGQWLPQQNGFLWAAPVLGRLLLAWWKFTPGGGGLAKILCFPDVTRSQDSRGFRQSRSKDLTDVSCINNNSPQWGNLTGLNVRKRSCEDRAGSMCYLLKSLCR